MDDIESVSNVTRDALRVRRLRLRTAPVARRWRSWSWPAAVLVAVAVIGVSCSSAELVQVEGGDGWRFLVVGPVFDVEPLGSFLVVDQADLDGRLEQAGFNEGARVDFDREAVLWVNYWVASRHL